MIPVLTVATAQQPACEVIFMKSLHDDDDWRVRAVLPALHRGAEPVDHVQTRAIVACLACLVRIVTHDGAGARDTRFASPSPGDADSIPVSMHQTTLLREEHVF